MYVRTYVAQTTHLHAGTCSRPWGEETSKSEFHAALVTTHQPLHMAHKLHSGIILSEEFGNKVFDSCHAYYPPM